MANDAYVSNQNAIKKAEADAKTAQAKAEADAKTAQAKAEEVKKIEKARRATQYKVINDKYAKLYANSFTAYQNEPNPTPQQVYQGVQMGVINKKKYDTRNQQISKAQQAELKTLREKHFTLDNFPFAKVGTLSRPAAKSLSAPWLKYNIDPKSQLQVDQINAKRALIGGNITEDQYFSTIKKAESVFRKKAGIESATRKAQSKAKNKGEVIQDRQKWNDTANSFFETKKQNDSNFLTSSVQPSKNYDTMTQKEYTTALREGKVNLATALLNQRTTGGYTGPNTVNIETFLTERGYDISKPETIPDSIFKPEKQLKARAQASKAIKNNSQMGDLRLLSNKYQKVNIGPNNFFGSNKIQTKKFKASDPLEFMGPTDKRKIENFKLMDNRPLNLAGFNNKFGTDMKTGETVRLKTVGETTSPEMQFFGQFIQGSRNTFDSYGNMLTNTGNFLTGKPQQPLARPPVQDQFFGAVMDSAKNTFEGPSENRASDPMGDFFNTQQKRINTMGYGQVAGELFTEGLIWATPVGAVGKLPKIAKGFFSPTVKTIKKSDNFIPGSDFMKLEGKTKNVGWGDQIGAFFGPKGPKGKAPISQPFLSSSVSLGKGTTKPKGKKPGNNFFSGSSGSGKKPGNFFDKPPKTTKTNTGLELIVKTKPLPKPKPFKSYPIQLGKTIPKTKTKPKPVQQFFKPQVIPKQKLKLLPKTKLKQKQKQQFFKPIPLITPRVKQKQKQILKQDQQFFKPIPKLTPKLTPKLKQSSKKKYQQTGIIAPFFPPTAKSTGMFLPPLPFFRQGGRIGRKGKGKRYGKKAYTAWNVNTKQVGSFLKGPTYKKSRSDYVFKDLDKRTKKAKKEKDYDYLDFF